MLPPRRSQQPGVPAQFPPRGRPAAPRPQDFYPASETEGSLPTHRTPGKPQPAAVKGTARSETPATSEPPQTPKTPTPPRSPETPEDAKTASPAKSDATSEPKTRAFKPPRFLRLRDQSKPTAKAGSPKPPPSTLKANLIGIAAGLFVAPIALVFFIWGCKTMVEADAGAGFSAIILGLFEILAGTALLSITGVATGFYSSLSWAVAALWPVLITVLASPIRDMVGRHNDSLTSLSGYSMWWDFLEGVSVLTASGLFPTMAIVMVGVSLASQIAYLSGRHAASVEHELIETIDQQPGEPVAPRSRLRDHLLSILVAVTCTTVGMLALIPLHDRLAIITGSVGQISSLPAPARYGLPILGILLLFLAVFSGSKSAAGLFVAGVFCGVIPGLILAFGEASTSGWAERLVGFLSNYLTASMHVSGGPLTAFGFVLLSCGLTLYWCRQSGNRDEYSEIEAREAS